MKRLIVFLILVGFANLVYCTIFHVDSDNENGPWLGTLTYPFEDIQQAIDDENVDDYDEIQVHYGIGYSPYDPFDFGNKRLTIKPYMSSRPVITGNTSIIVDMGDADYSKLEGFEIYGPSDYTGIYINGLYGVDIVDCILYDFDIGIEAINTDQLEIIDCEFYSNTEGLNIGKNVTNSYINHLTSSNFHDNTTAVYIDWSYSLGINSSLFESNEYAFDMCSNHYNTAHLTRVTVTNNDYGFVWNASSNFDLTNSIVYDNTTNFSGTPYDLDCDYSDIEGGFVGGNGNIDDDPYFCSEYPFEYWLMEGSPCIDTGDPTTLYADERVDMGCFETTYDIKPCKSEQYNYVSFQRLNRSGNNTYNVVNVIDNFLDWPLSDLTLDDITGTVLEYDGTEWDPISYNVRSTDGFKLYTEESGHHYMPTCYNASRLDPSTRLDLPGETGNWLGYWLPYTQNIEDAFGDFWEDVYSVEAEDWYYEYSEFETPTSSTTNKNMIYGKGYIIEFYDDVEDFLWTDATSRGTNRIITNPVPQYFSFDYQMNYEAIDVMEIPGNVVEIGVFEEDTCVGAVVVQEEDEQILVYSTEANRDNVPFTFQVVTTNRGENLAVSDYRIMNKETGRWENRSLISGIQRSSVVIFGNLEEIQNTTPNSSVQISNLSNYPNPFNPTTTISFDLNSELTEDTEITIYNMKGQKVKTLPIPQPQSLTVSVSWDGTDVEGKNVSSGLYFYKLKTADHEFSKKMLLLK